MPTDEAVAKGRVAFSITNPHGTILSIAPAEGKVLSVFLYQEFLPDPEPRVGQHITIVYDRVTGLVLQVIY